MRRRPPEAPEFPGAGRENAPRRAGAHPLLIAGNFSNSLRAGHCPNCVLDETSARVGSFRRPMMPEHENVTAAELNDIGRRIIRVDVPPAHAGIMAALRRAFEAAASGASDRHLPRVLAR